MIYVDDRVGSVDLAAPLKQAGLPVEVTRLEYGDFAFTGRGPNDKELSIGIELKRLQDMMGSLRTHRLSGHQLPGLLGPDGAYDYCWLVVEGHWRVNKYGQVLKLQGRSWLPVRGGIPSSEFEKRMLTLEMLGGFHVRLTNTRHDTVSFVGNLYRWFTDKSLDRHASHLAVHTPHTFIPISDFRAAVQRFPGIGLRTSLAVETHFAGSLRNACNAGVEEWAAITSVGKDGALRKIGIANATKIVRFVEGVDYVA